MHMKVVHGAESGDRSLPSTTRRQITSRLQKASNNAGHMLDVLMDEASGASSEAAVHGRAYHNLLCGAVAFEKRHWHDSLQYYSKARILYGYLVPERESRSNSPTLDLSGSYVEPSLRYAAYKLGVPRSTSIETIVKDHISQEEDQLMGKALESFLSARVSPVVGPETVGQTGTVELPHTIQWRSRIVKLEDAATAYALAVAAVAEERLLSFLMSSPEPSRSQKAAAYDELLIASQDAVDATKTAIDELSGDAVSQSDHRMQALHLTRTALHYTLISWRTGRNRVLCGDQDGAYIHVPEHKQIHKRHSRGSGARTEIRMVESNGQAMRRLKERIVLYDATLQSLETIHLLPGVAADQCFLAELESKRSYFRSLRCLALARSYDILGNVSNGLALLRQAQRLSHDANNVGSDDSIALNSRPPGLHITATQIRQLQDLLGHLITAHRGLVELHGSTPASIGANQNDKRPLSEYLHRYPAPGVDLSNIVTYPPAISPIPLKPIFLDVAFNYIQYPGQRIDDRSREEDFMSNENTKQAEDTGRIGWFRFGR